MAISREEAKQLLERLIFDEERSTDWVQDVWTLSPFLGDTAAKLVEVFDALIDCASEEKLDNLLQSLYEEQMNP